MNYVIFRQLVPQEIIADIVHAFYTYNTPIFDLGLKDGEDFGNVLYKSKRSPGLSYKYVVGYDDYVIQDALFERTGIPFTDSINDLCLPFFSYEEGGLIKAHRGVQKDQDTTKYQKYVAVLMLTQRGKHFEGGYFYLNSKATTSADGKTVYNDNFEDQIRPELDAGDMIVFDNEALVHGVDEVWGTNASRLTCSWRTNNGV